MAFVAHGVRIVERKGRERKSLDIRSSYAKERDPVSSDTFYENIRTKLNHPVKIVE